MKLYFNEMNSPIFFEENIVNVLVLENKKHLRKVIMDLINQIDGIEENIVFSISNKEVKMNRCVEFIINPFSLTVNNPKVIKKLYENFSVDAFHEEMLSSTYEIQNLINNFTEKLITRSDFDLSYDDQISIPNLLKILSVKFNDNYQSIVEKLIEYIELTSEILGVKLFIFLNLKTFLDKEELKELYDFCLYHKFSIFLIESTQNLKISNEKCYIIDSDLCEIY